MMTTHFPARISRSLLLLLLLLCAALLARATETENLGLQILPAPGPVTVDGQFTDWDLSGSIFACGDVQHYRDKFGVWFSAMYDAKNLYLLARWSDDTPMNNPGSTAGDFGWNGDCLQVRLVADYGKPTEQENVFNCWAGADGKDVVERDTPGKTKRAPKGDDVKPEGAQQAFVKNADGKGYVQEIAIPWALITSDGQPRTAGDSLVMTIEPNFTAGPTNGRMSIKDIFRPGVTIDRVFTFRAKRIWGVATLAAAGHVAPIPVRLSDSREFPVRLTNGIPTVDWSALEIKTAGLGFKPINFTLPEDGVVSLQILNDKGEVVRNLLTAEPMKKGPQEVLWDGLTTGFYRGPGQPAPAGAYTWRGIYHHGIGIALRGWACNSGQSPWDGPNPGDNWGGDMGTPCTVTTDGARMYLGWSGSEAGKAMVVTDLQGTALWHQKRGGFGGALQIAVDGGVAYIVDTQDNNAIYCVETGSGKYVMWPGQQTTDVAEANLWPAELAVKPTSPAGMDARNGKLYLTGGKGANGCVVIIDEKTGKAVQSIHLPDPGAIRVVKDDCAYLVSAGTSVLRLDPQTGKVQTVVDKLTNAAGLAVDGAGMLYVGVNAPDYQVKVFTARGRFVRNIGKKGGRPVLGPWQAGGMRDLAGMAVDANGMLWVMESTVYPKRISIWNTKTGALVKELFGPTHYGASGGAVYPKDPNVMVGEGCEWRIDPQTGQASCTGVFDVEGRAFLGGNAFARFCTGANGRDYLAVINGEEISIYERLAPGNYALRTTITSDRKAKRTYFRADAGDLQANSDAPVPSYPRALTLGGYYSWSMNMGSDMTLYGGGGSLAVSGFTKAGAPIYDPATFKEVPGLFAGLPSQDNQNVVSTDGNWTTYFTCQDAATGKVRWQYPSQFAGVHGSHEAPPPFPGMIRGAFGTIGCAKVPVAGYIWAVNTNVGEWHLLTQDGYYLTRLFEPDALKLEFPPKAAPGVRIDHLPCGMGGEDFGGSLVQAPDGKVYIEAGKTADWNCELTGLNDIKDLGTGTLTFTEADARQAVQARELAMQQVVGARHALLHQATPTFTGNLNKDFAGAEILSYKKQDNAAVRSALAWDAQKLYVAWEVTDNTPWVNGATDPTMSYLSGDTVDLQLGTDPHANKDRNEAVAGDLRLSIGNFQGTPTAVLYRKVSAVKKPRVFSSGVVHAYEMQYVDVLAEARIQVKVDAGKGYLVEASIPFAALGITPAAGLRLHGDLGVTHGDPAGMRTRLRTYWSNQQTGLVDDAVYELMMTPKNWGELELKP